jgi:hypothetical protein
MKILAASALALGLGLFSLSTSQAMPLAPVAPAADQAASGEIILVAQGCGPGFRRGPRGACLPMRPVLRCPPGMHPGPFGRCVRFHR